MEHRRTTNDELQSSWAAVGVGAAMFFSASIAPSSSACWREYVHCEREMGFRDRTKVSARAADNKSVLTVKTDADRVRVSSQGRSFMDRKGLTEAVRQGLARVLELCGPEASASVDVFIDPDDSSESLLIKVYAPKPFTEMLADVRRFNIEWQRGIGASDAFDDVLFMAGIE